MALELDALEDGDVTKAVLEGVLTSLGFDTSAPRETLHRCWCVLFLYGVAFRAATIALVRWRYCPGATALALLPWLLLPWLAALIALALLP